MWLRFLLLTFSSNNFTSGGHVIGNIDTDTICWDYVTLGGIAEYNSMRVIRHIFSRPTLKSHMTISGV